MLLFSAATITACAPRASDSPTVPDSTEISTGISTDSSTGSSETQSAHDASDVEVRSLDRAGYEQFILENRGRVVLVDFWATWCPPCMEGFPDTVRLSRVYKKQGLVVATMAIENLRNEPRVLEFLCQQDADLHNFISAYGGSDGRAMDEFELNSGTIPTLKLYDRRGNLSQTFGDGLPFTVEQMEVAIRQLLSSES